MKVYLDNCCFNRPFDDQDQVVIRLETEAKLYIQQMILDKKFQLALSFILEYENSDNPYKERKERIAEWAKVAIIDVDGSNDIIDEAKKLMDIGIRQKDALHISCAIEANAKCFITTDKKLLNKKTKKIEILSPIDFIRGYCDD